MSKNNSLRYDLRSTILPDIKDNHTERTYKKAIDAFTDWAKAAGDDAPKHLRDVDAAVIQRYSDALQADPRQYAPATIHTKLAPICKAAGVPMQEIRKPKRTAGKITRGRRMDANAEGKAQADNPRYERCMTLQRAVGVRRAELGRFCGRDWDGQYITVEKGKGGKRTRQYVLPEDREAVKRIFSGVKPDQRVLDAKEIPSNTDLHAVRAEHAQRCYSHFFSQIKNSPENREKYKSGLIQTFDKNNTRLHDDDPKRFEARRDKFIKDLDGTYSLRGENREKALELGLPTEYDKTALMAVSVLELAHWRLDVTVVNYMIR